MNALTPSTNDLANQRCILSALEFGRPQNIENLRGKINWDSVAENGKPLSTVLDVRVIDHRKLESVEDACLVLIGCALQDGRNDILDHADMTIQGLKNRHDPLLNLVLSEMNRVLMRFIQAGLDPRLAFQDDPKGSGNLLEFADDMGKDTVAQMFRACIARRVAQETMADINKQARTMQAKPHCFSNSP